MALPGFRSRVARPVARSGGALQKPAKRLVSAAAALLAAWAFFRAASALRPVTEAAAREANVPFGRFARAAARGARAAWDSASGGARAVRERDALRAENARLAAEAQDAAELRRTVAELRAALRFRGSAGRTLVAAEIVSEGGGAGWSGILRIDRGTRDGVVPGATVVAPAGLVGRVVSATSRTADVLPATDPNCRVSCFVGKFGSAGHGIAEGGGVSATGAPAPLRVSFLDAGLDVADGDLVFTAGDGGVFPRGIPVGTVESAGLDPTRLFQRALVRPAVDFGGLRSVFVRVPEAAEGAEEDAGEDSP